MQVFFAEGRPRTCGINSHFITPVLIDRGFLFGIRYLHIVF
jgi:hypothetical protein